MRPFEMASAAIDETQPAGRFGWGAVLFAFAAGALVALAAYTGFTR